MTTQAACKPSEAGVAALLRTLVPAWASRSPARIEYLPGGYTHRNYRVEVDGDAYVLRVVERNPPNRHERRFLAVAAAPDVIAYDERHGHMLTRWIEGRILAAAPPAPAEAGAYLADLHRQIPFGVRRYDLNAQVDALLRPALAKEADIASADRRASAAVAKAFRRLAWRPSALVGCHNDLNPWNIIRVEGGFRTLDWETAGDNDPLFDLAGLCVGLGWHFEQAMACVDEYRRNAMLQHATPQRLRETLAAFHVREYAWAAAQLAAGNQRDEIRQQAASMYSAVMGL